MVGNIIIALVILHAIFLIGKETISFGTVKIISERIAILITFPTITIPIFTTNILREITPSIYGIEQMIFMASHVAKAAIVTFPIFWAVIWISKKLRKEKENVR